MDDQAKENITFDKFEAIDMRVARVLAAPMGEGTRARTRVLTLDLGKLGQRTSVGQFALVDEADLVGVNVVACINLGGRSMGPYRSDALVLGTPHAASADGESQAAPLLADIHATPGQSVY